jgi:hypothetical protein
MTQAECISCGLSKQTKLSLQSAIEGSSSCIGRTKLDLKLIPEFHYNFVSFVAGFYSLSALVAAFKDEKGKALRNPGSSTGRPTVVILDHCGFWPMFLGCYQLSGEKAPH